MFQNNSKLRLIISNKQSAKDNMAIDEALVSTFNEDDIAILRVYSWEKSFTFGVSQKYSDFSYSNEYKNNFAKRITGGGILYHGHDISYSIIIPKSYAKNMNVKQTYENICNFILEFYKNLGLKASYAKDLNNITLSKSKYCQLGFEEYDIIINNLKIGGNAQKRTKNLIFQHGSIPIEKILSNKTYNIGNSLFDLGINLTYKEAELLLIKTFKDFFNIKLEQSGLNKKEQEKFEILIKEKYN